MKNKISIILILILSACANPMPPTGGPADKTSPVITRFSPNQDTVNFWGERITIEFNKYMNKNSVIENIFISPSVKMEYDWSGKELDIEFIEPLDSNTTYVFSLGTEYSDLKQNKPIDAFTLLFSTGSYLDSGAIKGNIFDNEPSGIYIYAYKIDGIDPDTLDPGHTKPNYRTQAGSSGNFQLSALKDGFYRVIAIRDIFKNELFDDGTDDFGAAPFDVWVKADSVPTINLKIGTPQDKVCPQLYDAESLFSNLIAVNFSEPLDTLTVKSLAFNIQDSLRTINVAVAGAMLSSKSNDRVFIIPSEPLDTFRLWKITAHSDNKNGIRDTAGILIQDTANFAYFYSVAEKDTVKFEFSKIPFKDSTKGIDTKPELQFAFNRPVVTTEIEKRMILLNEDSVDIDFDVSRKSDNIFVIIPKSKLIALKWYSLSFELDSLMCSNGSLFIDSTMNLRFQIKDTRNYGGAKGRIKDMYSADSSLFIRIFNDNNTFVTTPADSGKWSVKEIPEGKYQIELFYDLDKNGEYSFGDAYPFKHSEPFLFLKNEQEVPARWTIELTLPAPIK
ncbi:Ig-like domain-containing protein [Bacteroidota bacterium]